MTISIFKMGSIGAAFLMLIALPLYYIYKFRKDKRLMRNLLTGFIVYMLMNIMVSVISSVFDPNNIESLIGRSFANSLFSALTFTLAAMIVLQFALKRGESMQPGHLSLGFLTMFIIGVVVPLMNFFMIAFAINANALETALPGITPEVATYYTNLLTYHTPVTFLNYFTSRLFEFAVYGYAFLILMEGIKKESVVKPILISIGMIALLYLIPSLIATVLNNAIPSLLVRDLLVLMLQGIVAAYCFKQIKPWLSNS